MEPEAILWIVRWVGITSLCSAIVLGIFDGVREAMAGMRPV